MKYVIIIPDGTADEPRPELHGQTPLQAARIPAMDAIAASGVVGSANNVPASLPAGSDVACMSLLGYDPLVYFSGRAPLEAAAQGIKLGPNDWAVRCNLVTVQDQTMQSFTAGHISSEEARELLAAAQKALIAGPGEPAGASDTAQANKFGPDWEFVPGVSYRNLLLYRGDRQPAPFSMETRTTPPHDLTDKSVLNDFPRGPGSRVLTDLMSASVEVFANHPVNAARLATGKPPATNVWLWGLGRTPALPPFAQAYGGQSGAMITAVDLLRGLAALIGWDRIEVPGATGYLDTDYAAKGRYAIDALKKYDVVCVHIEATDEASHEGRTDAKIEALERIDADIVAPVHAALKASGQPYRLLITPDHPTPIRLKTHSHGAVPFAACGTGISPDDYQHYSEPNADQSPLAFPAGWELMGWFLARG
ncbi:MAG: cofactor-independent phosphoglycerate mutase [Pirellulales bacterium]|nr:cofactor-independent phosphoglycerate mutase [Pirellulales bacterium]